MSKTPEKWRPTLSMVVVSMLIFILSLPITGIWLFRFYDSQLVRETEKELIVQGAFIEALIIDKLQKEPPALSILGKKVETPDLTNKGQSTMFLEPELDLATSQIYPPRADPKQNTISTDEAFLKIGKMLMPILLRSQKVTLAGFRVLDPNGVIIAGRSDIGQSLAHVEEVKTALKGKYASIIRQRISNNPPPPIYTISRSTGIRVFVTMPVVFQGHVAGVVYLSRTPSHFLRELYSQRWKIGLAIGFMLIITFIIAYVFIRTIKGPIEALNARTSRIGKGDRTALEPLAHHGTRELADLSQGLLSMSKKLHERSDYINTFATHVSHELKSPLTSIQGAAELIRDSNNEMNDDERNKFLENIMSDTTRLTKLLERLRDLAAADNSDHKGSCNFKTQVQNLKNRFPKITINLNDPNNYEIKLTSENTNIIFSNLIENAQQHSATEVDISVSLTQTNTLISFHDNGKGISELNQDKIFELFFTTRRETGGTGMGLGIIQSMLNSHGGSIRHQPTDNGCCFEIVLPNN